MCTGQRTRLRQVIREILGWVKVGGATLSTEGLMWLPGVGWIAEVTLVRRSTRDYAATDVVLLPVGSPADPATLAERADAVIESINRPGAVDRAFQDSLPRALGLPQVPYEAGIFDPTPADEARRAASLARMTSRFDAVAAHFQRTYGLLLPRHLAVFAAFWDSLNDMEQRGLSWLGLRATGVTEYFADGGLCRAARNGLDPRLHWRFRRDPPEFVTFMDGDTDGLHYGLWYDDPRYPAGVIAHNYAYISAETWSDEAPTGLAEIARLVDEYDARGDSDEDYAQGRWPVLAVRRALEAFADADRGECCTPWSGVDRPLMLGSMGPALAPEHGDPRGRPDQLDWRGMAYRDNPTCVRELIRQARTELAAGQPAFALVLGRELHWLDSDEYRDEGADLLATAYRALDRGALAEIAAVHHAHRGLESVSVLVPPKEAR